MWRDYVDKIIWIIVKRYGYKKMPLLASNSYVMAILEVCYPSFLSAIASNRCPFCGKRFLSRGRLIIHLRNDSKCMADLKSFCCEIREKYKTIRQYIDKSRGIIFLKTTNPRTKCRDRTEAVSILYREGYL